MWYLPAQIKKEPKNYASMAVILKGDKKYRFQTVFLFKENGVWEVYAMD